MPDGQCHAIAKWPFPVCRPNGFPSGADGILFAFQWSKLANFLLLFLFEEGHFLVKPENMHMHTYEHKPEYFRRKLFLQSSKILEYFCLDSYVNDSLFFNPEEGQTFLFMNDSICWMNPTKKKPQISVYFLNPLKFSQIPRMFGFLPPPNVSTNCHRGIGIGIHWSVKSEK